jgi:NNP family nitrate/nitrite transporter-like MFS transporter
MITHAIDPPDETATATIAATPDGHLPTLIACFLHFDLSFMLWVLLGALGIFIAESVHLTPAQKGLVVAIPLLSGSLTRVVVGLLSDRLGSKRVGVALLVLLYVPLIAGWLLPGSLPMLLLVGVLLGTAGASFAVALPLASRWYPPQRQGLAMGVAAAGNSGTVITNLLAPRLATIVGWQQVLGLAMVPLTIVLVTFVLLAKERPRADGAPRASRRDMLAVLAHRDMWWFCLFYSVTFGGYVGLSSFLPLLLRDQYGFATLMAGYATALVAFVGSGSRPLGGYVADRIGGIRVLTAALTGVAIVYAMAARLPQPSVMVATLLAGMFCLGMGNGATFQLVPQRFREEIGTATGIIGAVGGLGGFLLPMLLGVMKQSTGSFAPAFLLLAALAGGAAAWLYILSLREHGWRFAWRVERDGIGSFARDSHNHVSWALPQSSTTLATSASVERVTHDESAFPSG